MDRTERLFLIAITILHVLAQVNFFRSFDVNAQAALSPSRHEAIQIASSPGVNPREFPIRHHTIPLPLP